MVFEGVMPDSALLDQQWPIAQTRREDKNQCVGRCSTRGGGSAGQALASGWRRTRARVLGRLSREAGKLHRLGHPHSLTAANSPFAFFLPVIPQQPLDVLKRLYQPHPTSSSDHTRLMALVVSILLLGQAPWRCNGRTPLGKAQSSRSHMSMSC